MSCNIKTLFITLLLVGEVFPMEDYIAMDLDYDASEQSYLDSSSSAEAPTLTSTLIVPSSTVAVPSSSEPVIIPTLIPSPELPPDGPILDYHNQSLYFLIQNLRIDFKHEGTYSISGSELNALGNLSSVMPTDKELFITYLKNGQKRFEFIFYFERGPFDTSVEDKWRLDSFQHKNYSEADSPLYNYTGPGFSINNLMGRGFNCSSIEFIGTAQVGEDTYFSRTKFMELSLQAFLVNGKVSSDFDSCNSAVVKDDGLPVAVIVALTVCACVVVASVIVTILAIVIQKYQKRRHYDLLSD